MLNTQNGLHPKYFLSVSSIFTAAIVVIVAVIAVIVAIVAIAIIFSIKQKSGLTSCLFVYSRKTRFWDA